MDIPLPALLIRKSRHLPPEQLLDPFMEFHNSRWVIDSDASNKLGRMVQLWQFWIPQPLFYENYDKDIWNGPGNKLQSRRASDIMPRDTRCNLDSC